MFVFRKCIQVLKNHKDEVWCVDFSSDGNILATAGKSGVINLWRKDNFEKTQKFTLYLKIEDSYPVSNLHWSYEDMNLLVTRYKSNIVQIYSTEVYSYFNDMISA